MDPLEMSFKTGILQQLCCGCFETKLVSRWHEFIPFLERQEVTLTISTNCPLSIRPNWFEFK